jgi:hypothetical protein
MFHTFCTGVARKMRRSGITKEAGARLFRHFYLLLLVMCRVTGLIFIIPRELYEYITGTGIL